MITTALIFLLVVTLAGLVAIERAVRNARPAYEDESGFHFEAVAIEATTVIANTETRRQRRSRTFHPAQISDGTVGEHVLTHSRG
jgi:hypothetical protein